MAEDSRFWTATHAWRDGPAIGRATSSGSECDEGSVRSIWQGSDRHRPSHPRPPSTRSRPVRVWPIPRVPSSRNGIWTAERGPIPRVRSNVVLMPSHEAFITEPFLGGTAPAYRGMAPLPWRSNRATRNWPPCASGWQRSSSSSACSIEPWGSSRRSNRASWGVPSSCSGAFPTPRPCACSICWAGSLTATSSTWWRRFPDSRRKPLDVPRSSCPGSCAPSRANIR